MLTPYELVSLQLKQDEIAFVGLARHVLAMAQSAYASWANWKAMAQVHTSNLPAAIAHHDFAVADQIRQALARDALLQAYRLTEPSRRGAEEASLPSLALALEQGRLRAFFVDPARSIEKGHSQRVAELAAVEKQLRIGRFLSLVASEWQSAALQNEELFALRKVIGPRRNSLVSSGLRAPLSGLLVEQLERFIELVLELAIDMDFVANGHSASAESVRENMDNQAKIWWQSAGANGIRHMEEK